MKPTDETNTPRYVVVGASGLVGETLLAVLEARRFAANRLALVASRRSSGRTVPYLGHELVIEALDEFRFQPGDVAFFAATGDLSRSEAPKVLEAGGRVIDKSSTFRADPDVPLVVPAVNGRLLDGGPRLVASPNCSTIGVVHALEPLHRLAGLKAVTITTLQAASGVGRDALDALEAERAGRLGGPSPFAARLADNVVPLCGELDEAGYATEERKLAHELRRIMELPELAVEATCIRVPVTVGHTASLRVRLERDVSLSEVRDALASFEEVVVTDRCPTPMAVAGSDQVHVGRLRRAANGDWLLVQTADNLRRGAATNALDCAERLLRPRTG